MRLSPPARRDEPVAILSDVGLWRDDYLTRILCNVSFEVRRGEVFGLVGAKDSGKTATLGLLAGQLRPAEGKVRVFGRSPRWRAVNARIGYLPPGAGGCRARGGLFGWFARKFPPVSESVSGPHRPILVQLLARTRELIILDEPFSKLDPAAHREMRGLIVKLGQAGKTVILSLTSLADVGGLCDRIAIIHGGEIQAVGSLDELLALPDMIHFTAPVLSPATAARVRNLIQADLNSHEPQGSGVAGKLDSLPDLQDHAPASPRESLAGAVDFVNHKLLAALTKPAVDKL